MFDDSMSFLVWSGYGFKCTHASLYLFLFQSHQVVYCVWSISLKKAFVYVRIDLHLCVHSNIILVIFFFIFINSLGKTKKKITRKFNNWLSLLKVLLTARGHLVSRQIQTNHLNQCCCSPWLSMWWCEILKKLQ